MITDSKFVELTPEVLKILFFLNVESDSVQSFYLFIYLFFGEGE